jgi:hypothetical protein
MHNLTIAWLDEAAPPEVATLGPGEIQALITQADEAAERLKRRKDVLEAGLALRYLDPARERLVAEGKDAGTARLDDGGITVVVEIPKRVDWDQDKLAVAVQNIPADERDQYVRVTYAIDERKYAAWPEALQAFFREARNVRTGKPRFRLIAAGERREVA